MHGLEKCVGDEKYNEQRVSLVIWHLLDLLFVTIGTKSMIPRYVKMLPY